MVQVIREEYEPSVTEPVKVPLQQLTGDVFNALCRHTLQSRKTVTNEK